MTLTALVVAGGAGTRMQRSGSDLPKPLVRVGGVPLVELNLRALVRQGATDLYVAVAAGAPDVARHLESCRPWIERSGAELSLIVEDPPLGSIGAAASVPGVPELLVVNADNVTSLDLAGMVAAHRAAAAAMTLAVHDEPFLMPFGEITVDGDRVTDYVEKPTYRICISSAVTVLGPPAVALVEPGEDVGLPVLARRVLDAGIVLSAHHHEADWADVNDLGVLERAERVVAAHPDLFAGARS